MSEHDNGDSIEVDVPPVTAPTFPVEKVLTNSKTFFQRTIGGGMQIKIVPLVPTPNGYMPHPEAVVILFSPEGWERFKQEVARDGAVSRIEAVRNFPEGLLNGGEH